MFIFHKWDRPVCLFTRLLSRFTFIAASKYVMAWQTYICLASGSIYSAGKHETRYAWQCKYILQGNTKHSMQGSVNIPYFFARSASDVNGIILSGKLNGTMETGSFS